MHRWGNRDKRKRERDRQTDRQTGRQTDRQTYIKINKTQKAKRRQK